MTAAVYTGRVTEARAPQEKKENAWRQAIERWLVEHGVMNIFNPKELSPIFP